MKIAMLTPQGTGLIAEQTDTLIMQLRAMPDTEVEVVPIEQGRQPIAHYREQAERFNAPDIDVVHIQHDQEAWGSTLRRRCSAYWELRFLIKKPVVLTAHDTRSLEDMLRLASKRRPLDRLLNGLLLRDEKFRDGVDIAPFSTAITIVQTAEERTELIRRGAKPGYVFIVPNGIPPPPLITTEKADFLAEHRLKGLRIVVWYGQLIDFKTEYFVMFDSLPPDAAVVVLRPVGRMSEESGTDQGETIIPNDQDTSEPEVDDEDQTEIPSRLMSMYGLNETETAAALSAADVVIVAEAQGINTYPIILPIALHRPILAPDSAAYREIAARTDCLELYKEGDAFDCKTHLEALLDNPLRRAKLSTNAERYAKRFSVTVTAALTRKVYAAAIDVFNSGPHHGMSMPE